MTDTKSNMPRITIAAAILISAVIVLYLINSSKTSTNPFEPNAAVGAEKEIKSSQKDSAVKSAETKPALADVVKRAKTWGPAFQNWFGKQAPDFTIKDISGKEHKLSSYIGKNVMLVFWATWCGPCRMEIPHLKELRNDIGEDKLAILAMSNEYPDEVARFASKNAINYTVVSYSDSDMKTPYNSIRGIPTTFFIDQQGKIKLVSTGAMGIEEMKSILDAQ